jgi:hypothetical protein
MSECLVEVENLTRRFERNTALECVLQARCGRKFQGFAPAARRAKSSGRPVTQHIGRTSCRLFSQSAG